MKLPFKYIAALVILSLAGIFAYQAYWLTGLYRTMYDSMERDITEAMRMSDYNEMMLRIEKMKEDSEDHGTISVTAGYSADKTSVVRSNTSITRDGKQELTAQQHVLSSKSDSIPLHHPDSSQVVVTQTDTLYSSSDKALYIDRRKGKEDVEWMDTDSAEKKLEEVVKDTAGGPSSALHAEGGLDLILRDQSTMLELATYFQRGLHSGLDILSDPNVLVYDSLLCLQLRERGITLPYRLEHLYTSDQKSSTPFVDTLAVGGTPGYLPGPDARQFNFSFDLHSHQSYRLWIEPLTPLVFRQMSGILTTSFVILLILAFSFWFLIRTILRQKTLEEIKSDFTNNITHELKTPIAVAYAANDALLNFNQAEEKGRRDKYLRICQEQLQRLSGLVEQILSMSMENRKTFRLRPEEVSVKEILAPLIEQHKLKAGKPVRWSVDIEPNDLTVTADPTHFSNILSNLIDNAIKYSPDEACVDIRCRRIQSEQAGRQVEISVSDHGIGISAEKQKRVFDKFYRVPTGNLHDVKGYGLGLFYVKTMTEKHGGNVSVKSEPGKGSTFIVNL